MKKLSIDIITQWNTNAAQMLYDHFYSALVSYALQILKEKESAEDIVQDTFTVLWERKLTLPSNEALRAYLYNTVRNKCLNLIRKQQGKYITCPINDYEKYNLLDEESEDLFSEEVYRQLFFMIDQMPPRQKEVFLMVMEGKKNKEIADALNIAIETVRTNKKRAMTFLRKNLDRNALFLLAILLGE